MLTVKCMNFAYTVCVMVGFVYMPACHISLAHVTLNLCGQVYTAYINYQTIIFFESSSKNLYSFSIM